MTTSLDQRVLDGIHVMAAQGFRQLASDELLATYTLRRALSLLSDQLTIHPADILRLAEAVARPSQRFGSAIREPATLH